MDMPVLPASHTVATFYQILLVESLIVVFLGILVVLLRFFWKRYGQEIMDEIGITNGQRSSRWNVPKDEDGHPERMIGHRVLLIGLAVMWMVDGLLQAQPALGTDMLQNIIEPVLSGQPSFLLNDFLDVASLLFSRTPLWMDSITVWIQLFIGIGILCGPERWIGRLSLRLSIVWGLAVWVFGEGLGQILTGGTWLTGAPGSVLFYVFIAWLLLRPYSFWRRGYARLAVVWVIALEWLVDAILQAIPSAGYWSVGGLADALLPMAQMNQPAWMAKPLYVVAHAVNHGAPLWNGLFVLLPLTLFVLWFAVPGVQSLRWVTGVTIFLTWWLCQDFGVIGGAGTDPNSGAPLLLILLSLTWLPATTVTPWRQMQRLLRRRNHTH